MKDILSPRQILRANTESLLGREEGYTLKEREGFSKGSGQTLPYIQTWVLIRRREHTAPNKGAYGAKQGSISCHVFPREHKMLNKGSYGAKQGSIPYRTKGHKVPYVP